MAFQHFGQRIEGQARKPAHRGHGHPLPRGAFHHVQLLRFFGIDRSRPDPTPAAQEGKGAAVSGVDGDSCRLTAVGDEFFQRTAGSICHRRGNTFL